LAKLQKNRNNVAARLAINIGMTHPFFTIGYLTRSVGEVRGPATLQEIKLVVEVQTIPRSRTNLQYNSEELVKAPVEFHINVNAF
jgi:hypothetical protein